jgi:hypothetical protein
VKVATERNLGGVIVNVEGIDSSRNGRCDGGLLLVPSWFESSEEGATRRSRFADRFCCLDNVANSTLMATAMRLRLDIPSFYIAIVCWIYTGDD